MVSFPNAKINIGLDILHKRKDGFHDIESCFYPIQWVDVLELMSNSKTTSFLSSGIEIPEDGKENICMRAYQLLSKYFKLPPLEIYLHKVVPIGAGLGGGSADAAFTLRMMNDLFKLELKTEDLEDFARKLGSDCAFFIQNKAQFCYEKGDKFEEINIDLKGKFVLLVYPDLHISTQEAYSKVKPSTPDLPLREALKRPIDEWKKIVKNDFEISLFPPYPVLKDIKEKLYVEGALYASMTGSGSTIYGIFENPISTHQLFPSNYLLWQGLLL